MSLFNQDETHCTREGNKCKRRKKCLRFQRDQNSGWVADYYNEFGDFCNGFISMPKREAN